MLVLKLEIWPQGEQKEAASLGELRVSNLRGLAKADYEVELVRKDGNIEVLGMVKDFPRLDKTAWDLIKLAIGIIPENS